jgi:glycosyltransferase involved in cell wall biosynthesis
MRAGKVGDKYLIAFVQDTTEIGYREIVTILRTIDRSIFEPVLIVPGLGPLLEEIADLGITTFPMYLPSWRKFRDLLHRYVAVYHLGRLLRDQCIDLIFCHGMWQVPLTCLAGKIANIPVVSRIGAILPTEDSRRVKEYWLCYPERLLFISEAVRDSFVHAGVPMEKAQLMYAGVEAPRESHFDRTAVRRSLGLTGDEFVVGCVARLDPLKGYYYLFKALPLIQQQVPNVKCVLVGDEPNLFSRDTVLGWVKELKVEKIVVFSGWQTHVCDYLAVMDIFCFPTLYEAFGIALIEAMAMGLPVVASQVGGVPEIVKEGETGFLVPPMNHQAIADRVTKLLKDDDLRRKMGSAGQKRVQDKFSAEHITRSLEQTFRDIIQPVGS